MGKWQVQGGGGEEGSALADLSNSLSFAPLVELYDETRTFDQRCFDAALDYLVERFPPQNFGRVCEPGIGTGRIAATLAERGYRVTGVDISPEMLALAQERAGIFVQQADATALPYPDAGFDLAIAVHLFYFIREWQRAAREMLRVVREGGPVVLMHTGTGAEIPFLNERYKALCAGLGCAIQSVGVESTRQVVEYYERLGCQVEWIRDRWRWTASIRLDRALDYLKARAYSFTTIAPDDVHLTAIERLESELKDAHGSLATEADVLNQVYLAIVGQARST